MPRRPRATAALLLALAACTGAGGEGADSATTADSTAVDQGTDRRPVDLPVVADEATDGDLILSVVTTGQIRSDAVVPIRSEVAGTVAQVLVQPGQRVRRGQVLVRLDPVPFDLAVKQREADVERARMTWYDNFVPDSIATGRGPSKEQREGARIRSGFAAAELALDQAKLDRERAVFTSPLDGVVDRIEVAPGARITAGTPITTVVDVTNLRIEASVLEHDIPLVQPGGQAIVRTAATRDTPVTGRIDAVLPLVDSTTRAGRAFVRLRGDGILRPGMYADVQLEATRLTGRRLVPAKAVIERDGRPLVFVVRDGRAQWTYILPGRTNGVLTEVLPDSSTGEIPVKAGDQVIVEGHLTLTHDAPVRPIAARERGSDQD
jgi:RND family efflux transporter MFP subunit